MNKSVSPNYQKSVTDRLYNKGNKKKTQPSNSVTKGGGVIE
jgi:hypothetical protein